MFTFLAGMLATVLVLLIAAYWIGKRVIRFLQRQFDGLRLL